MDLKGAGVVITGASRGIGAAAARAFAAAGAQVALLSRGAGAIENLAAEIGDQAIAIPCDVASYASVDAAIAQAHQSFGRLDVLINNAGVIEPIAQIAHSDPDAWGQVIDINLKGVYYGMRAALPRMLSAGGGTIITTSSGAAYNALEGWSHYCSSKAGALMMTMAAHREYGTQGIRVLGLSPGTVATEMQREIKASGINPVAQLNWEDHIPPEWPAKTLVWMCGTEADAYLGRDISLREEDIRRAVGLID